MRPHCDGKRASTMNRSDKRASLSSALLAVRRQPYPMDDAPESDETAFASAQANTNDRAPIEAEIVSIVKDRPIAKDKPVLIATDGVVQPDRALVETKPEAKLEAKLEATRPAKPTMKEITKVVLDGDTVLYGKGAASPEGFRPKVDNVVVLPGRPQPLPPPPDPLSHRIAYVCVVGFGCFALYLSTNLFVLSQLPVPKVPSELTAPLVMTESDPAPALSEGITLMLRGDEYFAHGDVLSARLFYERAADAGSGQAALRAGETFDPAFLGLNRLVGLQGEPAEAARWYRRARDLGETAADPLLTGLKSR
jgi:hypothetical protein